MGMEIFSSGVLHGHGHVCKNGKEGQIEMSVLRAKAHMSGSCLSELDVQLSTPGYHLQLEEASCSRGQNIPGVQGGYFESEEN